MDFFCLLTAKFGHEVDVPLETENLETFLPFSMSHIPFLYYKSEFTPLYGLNPNKNILNKQAIIVIYRQTLYISL